MSWEISLKDHNIFLYQPVDMFVVALMVIGSLLEPVSSGHLRNCSYWYFHVGFVTGPRQVKPKFVVAQYCKARHKGLKKTVNERHAKYVTFLVFR